MSGVLSVIRERSNISPDIFILLDHAVSSAKSFTRLFEASPEETEIASIETSIGRIHFCAEITAQGYNEVGATMVQHRQGTNPRSASQRGSR